MENLFDTCGFKDVNLETAFEMICNFRVFNSVNPSMQKIKPETVFLSKTKLREMLEEMDEGQNCFQMKLGLLPPSEQGPRLVWMMRAVFAESLPDKKYKIENKSGWYASESPEISETEPPGVQNPPYTEQ